MTTNEITDILVHQALCALRELPKGQRLAEIQYAEDLYEPDSTREDRQAYRNLWESLIDVINNRWSCSGKDRSLSLIGESLLAVTPVMIFHELVIERSPRVFDKNNLKDVPPYKRPEWTELVSTISERLMISSFSAFKRAQVNRFSLKGLADEFLRFMFTSFCYELMNQRRQAAAERKAAAKELSMDEPVRFDSSGGQKEGKEERGAHIPSDAYDSHNGCIIFNPGNPNLSFTLCIQDYPLKELEDSFIYLLSEKQQRIVELHLKSVTQLLEVPVGMSLSQYIAQTLEISVDAYYVHMTRIRKVFQDYVQQNEAGNFVKER